jgi:hypothetical protein
MFPLSQSKRALVGARRYARATLAREVRFPGEHTPDQHRNSNLQCLVVLYQVQRSHSDTDIRHSLSLHYDCYIPAPVSFAAPAKAILGNWETGGILTVQTGTSFTVLVSGVRSGRAIRILNWYPGLRDGGRSRRCERVCKLQCFIAPNPTNRFG